MTSATHWDGTPYVRVYAMLKLDHPDIWFDDRALAWLVRLLDAGEPLWPAPAALPSEMPVEVLELLVADGMIATQAGGRLYRIPSLDAERNGRTRGKAAGGLARVEGAERDELGRLTSSTSKSTESSSNGPASSSISSISPASDSSILQQSSSDNAGQMLEGPASSTPRPPASPAAPRPPAAPSRPAGAKTTSRAPAPAREAPARSDRPGPSPSQIYCEDYSAHHASHQWWAGIGWKCGVCEASKADADNLAGLSFREKVERAASRPTTVIDDDDPY